MEHVIDTIKARGLFDNWTDPGVYDLLKTNQFRYFKLGRTGYRISRKSFDEWLDKQ